MIFVKPLVYLLTLCLVQKHRLGVVLKVVNTHLGIPQDAKTKWSVDGEYIAIV